MNKTKCERCEHIISQDQSKSTRQRYGFDWCKDCEEIAVYEVGIRSVQISMNAAE